MDDDRIAGAQLVEIERRAHRTSGFVHIRLRLQQQDPFAGDLAAPGTALETAPRGRKPVASADYVGDDIADIVTLASVFDPGLPSPTMINMGSGGAAAR